MWPSACSILVVLTRTKTGEWYAKHLDRISTFLRFTLCCLIWLKQLMHWMFYIVSTQREHKAAASSRSSLLMQSSPLPSGKAVGSQLPKCSTMHTAQWDVCACAAVTRKWPVVPSSLHNILPQDVHASFNKVYKIPSKTNEHDKHESARVCCEQH